MMYIPISYWAWHSNFHFLAYFYLGNRDHHLVYFSILTPSNTNTKLIWEFSIPILDWYVKKGHTNTTLASIHGKSINLHIPLTGKIKHYLLILMFLTYLPMLHCSTKWHGMKKYLKIWKIGVKLEVHLDD